MKSTKIKSCFVSILFALFAFSVCDAKTLNLLEQPAANSKVIGQVNSENGVITIFTPKNSDWTKVADPGNGNVGWIKTSDLGSSSFHFNVISGDKGNQQYRIYQYGNMQPRTRKEIETEIKNMEMRQQLIQRDMHRMMNDMFSMMYYPPAMFFPVIVVPERQAVTGGGEQKKPVAPKK